MSTDTMDAPAPSAPALTGHRVGWIFLSLTRIAIGFIFLWAFLDKLLGLGYSTCRPTAEDGSFTVEVAEENELAVAQPNFIARLQGRRRGDPLAVDERAVLRSGVV